jgi:hypothetical protein
MPWPTRSMASTRRNRLRCRGNWHGLNDVEYATLDYVDWFNHRRLHGVLEARSESC